MRGKEQQGLFTHDVGLTYAVDYTELQFLMVTNLY
jgi:hypothetical protein